MALKHQKNCMKKQYSTQASGTGFYGILKPYFFFSGKTPQYDMPTLFVEDATTCTFRFQFNVVVFCLAGIKSLAFHFCLNFTSLCIEINKLAAKRGGGHQYLYTNDESTGN